MLRQDGDDVKAPRSAGCRTCVRRRIKCDLAKPRCMRCVNSSRRCPGYEPTFKFIDEGPSLRSRHSAERQPRSDQQGDSSETTTTPSRTEDPLARSQPALVLLGAGTGVESGAGESARQIERNASTSFQSSAMLTFVSPTAYQAQLLSLLVGSFSTSHQFTVSPGEHSWSKWLQTLAGHQHSSPALNSAIRAISLSHLGRNVSEQAIVLHSRQQYGKALAQLSASLRDPTQGLSLEALIATVMLSFYEVQNCTAETSWIRHASAAARLLRLRGVDMHREGMARSTLTAYRPFLIVEAMEARQPCFLDTRGWREVLHQAFTEAPKDPLRDAIETFYLELARHPSYYQAFALSEGTTDVAALWRMLRKGQALRQGLKDAHAEIARALESKALSPSKVSSDRKDPVFPNIYKYPSSYIGSVYCGYWTELTVIDQMLKRIVTSLKCYTNLGITGAEDFHAEGTFSDSSLSWSSDETRSSITNVEEMSDGLPDVNLYDLECVDNALQTCMSTENLSTTAFLGSTYLIFALRAAMNILDSKAEKEWIRAQMQQISKDIAIAEFDDVNMIWRRPG